MVNKRWAIIADLEKLTGEDAINLFSPSMSGRVKIKGKYIRDENGKLVPVLVKTKQEAPSPIKEPLVNEEKQKPEQLGILTGFKKLLSSILRF